MTRPSTQRFWFAFAWLRGWSRWERLIVAAFGLAPVATLLVGGLAKSDLAAGLLLLAWAVLNVVVFRHGGWRLLGPHFYYDVVRLARRGRSNALRVVYLAALFLGLWLVYRRTAHLESMRLNDFAAVAESFAFALFRVQNIAVLILTPAYLGSAIAEERERRTLDLLFTTQLSDTEIILGKLFARIIHLVGFVLAGWPILCVIQFWGGVDMLLIAGNLANTLLLILSVGSFCLLLSTLMRSVTAAVLMAYAVLAPTALGCVQGLHGFPLVLEDARSGVTQAITVQDLAVLSISHGSVTVICLVIAVMALRAPAEYFDVVSLPERLPEELWPPQFTVPEPLQLRPAHNYEPGAVDALAVPYALPPITDHALFWKERYVGGPSLLFSPVVLVPIMPFALTGVALLVFWHAVSLTETGHELERSRAQLGMILRACYYLVLGGLVLSVSFRASASVARERQQQTLEPLLLLPIERREILVAKLLTTLMAGWPWMALIAGDALLGIWFGAYHPVTALAYCLAPWPMIVFFTTFGLLMSVLMRTVLRAYLAMVVLIVMVIGCTLYGAPLLSYMEAFAIPSPLQGVHPVRLISFGLSAIAGYAVLAVMCWILAVRRFEDRI
jgi:ABC-type transport system involved in multi-copper enzyme maturation permease subunit